jgi:hypothetical protein
MGLARMERAKPIVVQTSDVVVTADELLLRHAYRRSYAHSDAGRIGRGLESPNLLSTRPDVYIESRGYAGPRCQGACAVCCDCIDSWPSGDVENNRAPDIHRAEWIERRTISVEPEALHNGFRYQAPTHVCVPVEGPQIQAPEHAHAAMPVDFRPRGSGCARRHSGSQAHQCTGEGQGSHYNLR